MNTEPHDFVEDCDCRECAIIARNQLKAKLYGREIQLLEMILIDVGFSEIKARKIITMLSLIEGSDVDEKLDRLIAGLEQLLNEVPE